MNPDVRDPRQWLLSSMWTINISFAPKGARLTREPHVLPARYSIRARLGPQAEPFAPSKRRYRASLPSIT